MSKHKAYDSQQKSGVTRKSAAHTDAQMPKRSPYVRIGQEKPTSDDMDTLPLSSSTMKTSKKEKTSSGKATK